MRSAVRTDSAGPHGAHGGSGAGVPNKYRGRLCAPYGDRDMSDI